ncbi:MAG: exonuclease domain-containing protein [Solirubrobacteraceae bacterium]
MIDLAHPLSSAEFLVVDTETNGQSGEHCEVTEVGAVLVGGGELHDRWETLCAVNAPLSRGIQRFTGISQDMLDDAPPAETTLPELAELMEGRVLVAHSASFDSRVLAQAFRRAHLEWPDPPVLCTVALARRLHPLARQRKLRPLAESLGIDVEVSHRALADAETCARVFCALFGRLCANATTIGDALALVRPAKRTRRKSGETFGGVTPAGHRRRRPDVSGLPGEPGVYIVRNEQGQTVYVGKSTDVRTRVRSHFLPSSPSSQWTLQAESVDCETTNSELGALVLERRMIRRLRPPGNAVLKHVDAYVYLRCRFDISFPVLEVAPEPASGHAVSIGPLRGRAAAVELKEQLDSLFGLRHCGRGMPRREWASAYGQMGRCLSPCLGDLDPNLYRRRLDEALGLFSGPRAGRALLDHVGAEIAAASAAQQFERAAWLTRRRARLTDLLSRLGDALSATHARPRLVLAPHPRDERRFDAFWLVDGRIADWGPLEAGDPWERTQAALRHWRPAATTSVPPDEIDEIRCATTWIEAHRPPSMVLDGRSRSQVLRFVERHAGVTVAA